MGNIIPSRPTSPLTSTERKFLGRVHRFLVYVVDPSIGARAAAHGYDEAEHKEGWALHNLAVGTSRPFEHFLSATEQAFADDSMINAAIKELDEFENTWFPRVRNAIRRFVDKDSREAVEAAFFVDLQQQPAGPLVIGSVDKLLARLAGLAKSDAPGATAAYKGLVKKGLTKDLVKEIKGLVASAKVAQSIAPPPISVATQLEAATAQRDALDQLRLWYTDWADALRPVLSYHDAIRLGLRKRKGGRRRSAPDLDLMEDDDSIDDDAAVDSEMPQDA